MTGRHVNGLSTSEALGASARPDSGHPPSAPWVLSSGLLLFSLLVAPTLQAQCTKDVTRESLSTARGAAVQALIRLELGQSIDIISEAIAGLSCAVEVIPAQTVAELYRYEGMAYLRQGKDESALLSYRKALALSLALDWDSEFGPELQAPFEETRVTLKEEGTVRLHLRADEKITFYVDGVAVTGDQVLLRRGLHYVQALRGIKVEGTLLVTTMNGDDVSLEFGDIKRSGGVTLDRSKRRNGVIASVAAAVLGGTASALAFRDATNTYERWTGGEYSSEVVSRNHLGIAIGWTGLAVGITGAGVGTAISLLTRPTPVQSPVARLDSQDHEPPADHLAYLFLGKKPALRATGAWGGSGRRCKLATATLWRDAGKDRSTRAGGLVTMTSGLLDF